MTTFVHSVIYAMIFSLYVLGTLAKAPRLWLRHYPPIELESQPSRTRRERQALALHATVFLGGIILAAPVFSAWIVFDQPATRSAVFTHILILGVAVSAVDWLILDWLLIRWLQPTWLIPADTNPLSWRDRTQLIKDAVGFPIGCLIAAVWAWLASVIFF